MMNKIVFAHKKTPEKPVFSVPLRGVGGFNVAALE